MSSGSTWSIAKETFNGSKEHRVLTQAAALAYYALFSIGPLLVIAVGVAGLAFSQEAAGQKITQQIQGLLGENAARTIQSIMSSQQRGQGIIATLAGVVLLFLAASGAFGQLRESLNLIGGVKPKRGQSVFFQVFDRLFAILIVLGIGLLLMASMLMTALIALLSGVLEQIVPVPGLLLQLGNLLISLAVVTFLFGIIFKVVPDVRIAWRSVRVGAFCTGLLFTAGQFLFSLYLGRQSTASPYGTAGSVVVVLMWIYYSSVILFVGAELTQACAKEAGAGLQPGKYAIRSNPEPHPGPMPAEAEGDRTSLHGPEEPHDRPDNLPRAKPIPEQSRSASYR